MYKDFHYDYGYSKEELNQKLQNYEYNKKDNPVYKNLDPDPIKNEKFKTYKSVDLSLYNQRKILLSFLQENTIKVSNLGRIMVNDKILSQYQKQYGYLYVKLNNEIEYPVYRLVAEVWCKCPVENTIEHGKNDYWIVHHITNNGFDNRDTNLLWMLRSDHSKLSHKYLNYEIRKKIKNEIQAKSKECPELLEKLDDLVAINYKEDKDFIKQKFQKFGIDETSYSDLFWNLKNK